jgi:hypothetical protein
LILAFYYGWFFISLFDQPVYQPVPRYPSYSNGDTGFCGIFIKPRFLSHPAFCPGRIVSELLVAIGYNFLQARFIDILIDKTKYRRQYFIKDYTTYAGL